jgi:GT2 family glycosyltransferase
VDLHDRQRPVPASLQRSVTVVVATRNRRDELLRTLGRLAELSPSAPLIVVDNRSDDGTTPAVRERFAEVKVLTPRRNLAAAGRNLGVRQAATPYVAFSDDDSWWAPGALERAAAVLERHPRVALVVARTLVGPQERPDPMNRALASSPLPAADGAGPSVLGFLACSAVVRRDAFLRAGGFSPLFGVGGEETLLAYDLAAAGWRLCYREDVVCHHHPSTNGRDPAARSARQSRNAVLTAWLRRPLGVAARMTGELAREALVDPVARAALAGTLVRLPTALAGRRSLPEEVERQVRLLEEPPVRPERAAPVG